MTTQTQFTPYEPTTEQKESERLHRQFPPGTPDYQQAVLDNYEAWKRGELVVEGEPEDFTEMVMRHQREDAATSAAEVPQRTIPGHCADTPEPEDAPERPFFVSAREVFETDFPDPVWIVPDLLPIGLCLFAGKAKLGKSWAALQLAQAVASGGTFLGRRLKQGKVVYFALEDSPRRLQSRMRKQGWTGAQLDNVDLVMARAFMEEIGDIGSDSDKLIERLAQVKPRLAIIDTLSRVARGDQDNVTQMTQSLQWLQMAAWESEYAVFMIDHHNKALGNMDAVANILGSTAKGAVADTIWGLYRERGKADATLAVTGRDVEEVSLHARMDWSIGYWQLQERGRPTEGRQALLDALESMGPSSNQEIADAVGRNKGNVYKDLQELVATQWIDRLSGGKYGKRERD